MKKIVSVLVLILTMSILSGCAALGAWGEAFNRAWQGVPATLTTYNEDGILIDRIKGESFNVGRNAKFDSVNSEGVSAGDSQVLLISSGGYSIDHVGSSMILAEEGLVNIMTETNSRVDLQNNDPGVPWLNNLAYTHQNLWGGKAKTLMIRSQDGTPIAVFAGDEVEVYDTDVPKSTWFRVDGKMLWVYRTDYTTVPTAFLLEN